MKLKRNQKFVTKKNVNNISLRNAFYFFQLISTKSKLKFLISEFLFVYNKYINTETGLLRDKSINANNPTLLNLLFLINDSLVWNQCVNSNLFEEKNRILQFVTNNLNITLNLEELKESNKTLYLIFYWMLKEIVYVSGLYTSHLTKLESRKDLQKILTDIETNPDYFNNHIFSYLKIQKALGLKANVFDQKYLKTFIFTTCNTFNLWSSSSTLHTVTKKSPYIKKSALNLIPTYLSAKNNALLSLGLNKTIVKAQKFNLSSFRKTFFKYRLNTNLYKYSFLKFYLQRNIKNIKNANTSSGNLLPMNLVSNLQFKSIKDFGITSDSFSKVNPNIKLGNGLIYTKFGKRSKSFQYKMFHKFLRAVKYPRVHNNSTIKENNIFRIDIKIATHNIFCTFIDLRSQQTLFNINGGSCNQNIPRKANKYYIRLILKNFISKIKEHVKDITVSSFVFRITCARHLKMFLLNMFKKDFLFTGMQHIVVFDAKKAFNGCRAKKAIRKKRRFGRVFK